MKLKRLLTGVLSAVMALSVCAMPAMAAGTTTAATQKTGSLTITKYEQPHGSNSKEWQDTEKGNPLKGVTFTVYKVADVNQTVNANGNVSFDYDLVAGLKDQITINWESCLAEGDKQYDSAKLFEAFNTALTANNKKLADWHLTSVSKTTNEQGVAEFAELATGVYMVEETSAPAQITSRTANFMVSIPMTVTKENGTQEITYNVKAEPKNVSTYGGVTLNKYGQVAGSTSKTLIAGAVFQLYRNNGTEGASNWEAVDLTAKGIKVDNAVVSDENAKTGNVTTTDKGVNITGLTPGSYYFKEISAPAGYIADTKTEHKFKLNDEGKVIVGSDEKKSIDVVNEKPDFEKVVTKRDGTKDNHNADYGIGDKVPYTLTVKVPSTIANLKTFYVTDTINTDHTDNPQLAYDESSFKVSCDGVALNAKDYTLVFTKAENKEDVYTGFKIDFKNGTSKLGATYADKAITISYTAKLLEGAVTTKAGNINKAELVYSNKTNIDSTAEELESDKNTIHDESVVYTFKTSIYKTGAGNAGALTGVKFDLYKVLEEGTDYTKTADGKLPDTITFRGTTYSSSNVVSGSSLGLADVEYLIKVNKADVTTENGNASVSGLPKGTYYWVETKALDGYNLLTEPVKADLQVTYNATWITKSEYENGKLVKHEYSNNQTEYPTATVDKVINIVNRKGFTLPVTGGFGTLLFSGIGVLLVLAGVCVLFSMKKKNNRT